jgi:hypothetical protein
MLPALGKNSKNSLAWLAVIQPTKKPTIKVVELINV